MSLLAGIKESVDKIVAEYKKSAADGLSFSEVFSLASNAVATFVELVELAGGTSEEKKAAVLEAVELFYDEVIAPLDIKQIPNFIEPMLDNALKGLILVFADGAIDSIVNVFNKIGWFSEDGEKAELTAAPTLDNPLIF